MNFTASEDHGDSITAHFEDGSAIEGSLVVACDGAKSLLRKELFAQQDKEHTKALPIRMLGVKLSCTPEEIAGLRKMDPFFLHGTSSHDNSFGYFSSKFPSLASYLAGRNVSVGFHADMG